MQRVEKILVIRGGAIGDFILTLPVFAALRQAWPESRIEILGYPHIASLAVADGLADEVFPIESSTLRHFFVPDVELPSQWREFFAAFDLIISFAYDPERIFQGNIARCSKARFIAAPHRPSDSNNIHATDVFLSALEGLGLGELDSAPRLRFVNRSVTMPEIAVHPGSGSERKNWPVENWAEFLERITTNNEQRVLLVGGEAESGKIEFLASRLRGRAVEVARELSLVELAKRLGCASFFLGHDSGITHMAAAIGLPGIALWGETNVSVWRPRSDRISVVHAGRSLADLAVDCVWSEFKAMLARRR